jgi:CRISPR/Cas system CSM-associated protein Csm3 (group 7 of RAMP superfamily)
MYKGILKFNGIVKLYSPLIIGSGEEEFSDTDILKDKNGTPYIPATSFIGSFSSFIRDHCDLSDDEKKMFNIIFPDQNDKWESLISCSDLVPVKKSHLNVVLRDGIGINPKNGMVKKDSKFDYQAVDRGAKFKLNIEIKYMNNQQKSMGEKLIKTLIDCMNDNDGGLIGFGAKTNNGFGKITLDENSMNYYEYDFTNKESVLNWIQDSGDKIAQKPSNIKDYLKDSLKMKHDALNIEAYFKLKSSLIIRSYSDEPSDPDSSSISYSKQNGAKDKIEYFIPGTSLKGTIRTRCVKILNTILPEHSKEIVNDLFGFVETVKKIKNEDDRKEKAVRSRIKVRDTILPDYADEVQSRIAIDRFTGGVIDGALFDSKALFDDGGDKVLKIEMTVNSPKSYEAGLLLLILKDLSTGDLAIGGEKSIGRGVLKGINASIKYSGNKELKFDLGNIAQLKDTENGQILQDYVAALINYPEEKGALN